MNAPRLRRHRQRGVSTLLVVMVLLFVVTMVAAYASRNMIFEQRTGANYLRATSASEVAEAGLQWAVSQLNAGRIDDACVATADPTAPSFRQRYLAFDASTGAITARMLPAPLASTPRSATCVFDPDADSWACSCVQTATSSPAAPASDRIAPAFRVFFESGLGASASTRPGIIALNVTACTRLSEDCLSSSTTSLANEGRAYVRALLYQGGFSMVAPVAALTARGVVDATGLTVSNSRFGDSGMTVHAGGSVNHIGVTPGLALNTLAGNALSGAGTTLPDDLALSPADLPASAGVAGSSAVTASDRFFALAFNLLPQTARRQPAMVDLGDCGGGCDEADVVAAVAANPGRPIWVEGDLDIDSAVDIGTETEPVVLIVDGGNLSISAAGAVIRGLVYVRPDDPVAGWTIPVAGTVRGAVVVDGAVVGTGGSFQIDYDGALLRTLRAGTGSLVMVPGGWRDSPRPL